MRKLPQTSRNIGVQKVYNDVYSKAYADGVEKVIAYLGDSVLLLKPVEAAYREIDTTGTATLRGRYGSRRDVSPVTLAAPKTYDGSNINNPSRTASDIPLDLNIPAIVDMSPPPETRQAFGYRVEDTGIMTLSKVFMEKNQITVNAARDLVEYRGYRYKLRSVEFAGTFQNYVGGYTYIIRRDD